MTRFPIPPKSTLEDLYTRQRKTLREIAKLYGCSYQTVWRWLRAHQIHPPKLSKSTLTNLHWERALSSRQIAARTGFSYATVQRWLREYRIPARRTGKLVSKEII